jgi:hypothetical protein
MYITYWWLKRGVEVDSGVGPALVSRVRFHPKSEESNRRSFDSVRRGGLRSG